MEIAKMRIFASRAAQEGSGAAWSMRGARWQGGMVLALLDRVFAHQGHGLRAAPRPPVAEVVLCEVRGAGLLRAARPTVQRPCDALSGLAKVAVDVGDEVPEPGQRCTASRTATRRTSITHTEMMVQKAERQITATRMNFLSSRVSYRITTE